MGCFHIVHVYDMMIGHKDELCCGNIILDLRGSVYHLGPVDDSTDGCSETREFDWYNERWISAWKSRSQVEPSRLNGTDEEDANRLAVATPHLCRPYSCFLSGTIY